MPVNNQTSKLVIPRLAVSGLEQQQQHKITSAVQAEIALATKRLAKGRCGPPDDATMFPGDSDTDS